MTAAEPLILDRLFQFARPIADAATEPKADMRVGDGADFFLAFQAFELFNPERMREALLALLDEFAHLDRRSYDELYLWSIVYLSRLDLRHVETFWPLAIALDLRYRAVPWQREAGVSLVDQPYRFTELLFYCYALHSGARRPDSDVRIHPSLASAVQRLAPALSPEQRGFMMQTLRDLGRSAGLPDFGDAAGLLLKP